MFPKINFANPNATHEGAHVLLREQTVSASRTEVFRFFSDPHNLQLLTPPWLHFHIVTTPEQVTDGALIRYQLRLHRVPLHWKTRIESWQPNSRFVDTQLAGPYSLWHHTHEFEDHESGTLIRDIVKYKLPFGVIGKIINRCFVRADVEKIFDYRCQLIIEQDNRWNKKIDSKA